MIGWITAIGIVVIVGVLVWLIRVYSRLEERAQHEESVRKVLQKIGAGLGIDSYDERNLFGAHVHRLWGTFNDVDVEVEVHIASGSSYLRVTLEFPHSLGQELYLMSPRKPGIWNRVLRLSPESFPAGEDESIELMVRSSDRVEQILSPAIKFQIGRLLEFVDDLRIGDETVYLMHRGLPDADTLRSVLTKSLEIAERIVATSEQLGPSPSKVDATVYEQATTGMFSRVDAEEMGASKTGRFTDPTSTQRLSPAQTSGDGSDTSQ